MRALGLLFAVLVVAAAAWLLLVDAGPSEPSLDPDADPEAERDAPVTLTGAGEAATAAARTRGSEKTPGAKDAPEDGAAAAPGHLVEGRVEGLGPNEWGDAVLRVHAVGSFDWVQSGAVEGSLREDGRFAIDIGGLRDRVEDLVRVQVSVDHPAYVVMREYVALAAGDRTRLGRPLVVTRAIRVQVRVRGAGDEPLEEARVALVATRDGAPHVVNAEAVVLDSSETNGEGAAVLRIAMPGAVLLVVGAEKHLAAGRLIHAADGMPAPRPFVLEPAVSIEGRVFLNGAPASTASVRAGRFQAAIDLGIAGLSARWHEGSVVAGSVYVRAGEDGRYSLDDLSPGPWTVTVASFRRHQTWRTQAFGGPAGAKRTVEAPATGVDFTVRAAVVVVRTVSEGEPVGEVQVNVGSEQTGFVGTRTDEEGVARFVVPPRTPFQVHAEPRHHAEKRVEVTPLGDEEERTQVIELGPRRPEATLVVTLTDSTGDPVTRAGFQLDPKSAGGFFGSGLEATHEGKGVFRLEGLETGPRTLRVYPGRALEEFHGHFLVADVPVDLRPDRETRVAVRVKAGTRVFVTVKDEAGNGMAGSATLRDGAGEKVDVAYFWSDDDSASMSTGNLGPVRTTIEPPLAAGAYELVCSRPGYAEQRVSFRVGGEPEKDLVVTLQKQ